MQKNFNFANFKRQKFFPGPPALCAGTLPSKLPRQTTGPSNNISSYMTPFTCRLALVPSDTEDDYVAGISLK